MKTKRPVFYKESPATKTRHAGLGYEHRGDHWRIVTTDDGCGVGPQYQTKAELLADLDRFATDNGF